jgi:hypothetical protein
MSYQYIEKVETFCENCVFADKKENKQVGCKADQLNTTYREELKDGAVNFIIDKFCVFFRKLGWNNNVPDVEKAKNEFKFKPLVVIDADFHSLEDVERVLTKDATFRLFKNNLDAGKYMQFVKDKAEEYDISVEFVLRDEKRLCLYEFLKKSKEKYPVFIWFDGLTQKDIKDMTEFAQIRFLNNQPFGAVIRDKNIMTFSAMAQMPINDFFERIDNIEKFDRTIRI